MKVLINKYYKLLFGITILLNIIIILFFKPSCPWKINFNIDCAGCGTTRMIESIIKLDFYQAFRFNPLVFIFLLIFMIYGIYITICKLIHKNYYKLKNIDLLIILILIILFMILRNIPGLEYLKPTNIR